MTLQFRTQIRFINSFTAVAYPSEPTWQLLSVTELFGPAGRQLRAECIDRWLASAVLITRGFSLQWSLNLRSKTEENSPAVDPQIVTSKRSTPGSG
jgi:hypothetical protein